MAEDDRPHPDAVLAALQRAERTRGRGRIKVFLGMAPGVGKTFAMLEAAHREQASGRDVILGYVETHKRAETEALAKGLPQLPRRQVEYRGIQLEEMDLDALLSRHPQLVVVDELAHTNAPGSRHPKRYQDVEELLSAGIDVFTTLNVQHVGSRAEVVREITGVPVSETVPDTVLDGADLELIDLPPAELLRRLAEGKVYVPDRAAAAAQSFFRPANLAALRELALRLTAEHAGEDTRFFRSTHDTEQVWKTGARLLMAISPSPLSGPMARWTRRLADSWQAPWLAVYVDTGVQLSEPDRDRLQQNLSLARELGAEVLTTSDRDVVRGLLRVARQNNATQIVVGKPIGFRAIDLFRGGSVLSRLIRDSGNIDVHCVQVGSAGPAPKPPRWPWRPRSTGTQYAAALAVVALTTLLNFWLRPWTGSYAVSLLYLLSVVLLALSVGRGPVWIAAAASALLWDYFFLEPVRTFYITKVQDGLMFGMFFVVALAMGQLTARLRAQQAAEREREERATALYLLTRELAERSDLAELLGVVLRHLDRVFAAQVAILLPGASASEALVVYPFGTLSLVEKDLSVAGWVYANRKPAGRGTDTLPSSPATFWPLLHPGGCLGVVGLARRDGRTLALPERNLLENFLQQIAVVLDRQRLRDAEEQARVSAESERLGKTLLNSISHELRTPLSAITSATSSLLEHDALPPAERKLASEIQTAATRLNQLVRNLLDEARLESGQLRPRFDWCDPADLCQVVVRSTRAAFEAHRLSLHIEPDLPLIRADFVLLEQALSNVLLNAAIHTPPGTAVEFRAAHRGAEVVIEIADHGPGLSTTEYRQVFDRFYRAEGAKPGGSGLGLSIAKGFVEANGGQIEAGPRSGGGALFRIRLPVVPSPKLPAEPT